MPTHRFFSLTEANRTLPLVRRIVEDIVEEAAGDPAPAERAERIEALIHELEALGCHFKGADEGLVDWYSLYAGRTVLLCWKLGEPEIGWWHQADAGFAGRQPILDSQRDAFQSA